MERFVPAPVARLAWLVVAVFLWAPNRGTAATPPHDAIGDALAIAWTNLVWSAHDMAFAGATAGPEDPVIPGSPGYRDHGTVWVKWTTERWTDVTVSADNLEGKDLGMALFERSSDGSLVLLAVAEPRNFCGDLGCHRSPRLAWRAHPRGTFYLSVFVPGDSAGGAPSAVAVVYQASETPALLGDLFAQRVPVEGPVVDLAVDNTGATRDAGEPAGTGDATLWWDWVAPADGFASVRVRATAGSPVVGVFRGDSPDALQPVAAGTSRAGGFPVAAGEHYAIAIGGVASPGGPVAVQGTAEIAMIPSGTPPANDDLAGALPLGIGAGGAATGDLTLASTEASEPGVKAGAESVWYALPSPGDGFVTLTGSAARFSPGLAVYRGASMADLVPVPGIESGLVPPAYRVHPGETLRVQVSALSGWPGEFSLAAAFEGARANDAFADRIPAFGTNLVLRAWVAGGTLEPGEPPHPASLAQSAWWTWQAPASGMAVVTGGSTDASVPTLSVFTGASLDRLVPVPLKWGGPADPGHAVFQVAEGQVYQIRAMAPEGAEALHWVPIALAASVPLANDRPEHAVLLHGSEIGHASTLGATRDPDERATSADANRVVWWKWRAQATTAATITYDRGTIAHPVPVVFRGETWETAVPVELVPTPGNPGSLRFAGLAGSLYWLGIQTSGDDAGELYVGLVQRLNGFFTAGAVPGDLLLNGSFDLVRNDPSYGWGVDNLLGAHVHEVGGVDGITWVDPSQSGEFWTEFATEPGSTYRIRFATLGYGAQNRLRVEFGGALAGEAVSVPGYNPDPPYWSDYPPYWQWEIYDAVATSATTRLSFRQVEGANALDAVSVVRFSASPSIRAQPADTVAFRGLAAGFSVDASGSPPLHYAWRRDDVPVEGAPDAPQLLLTNVQAAAAGRYRVVVSNAFGSVTSDPAILRVEDSPSPVIVSQPIGDALVGGQRYALAVSAIGAPPLSYQWSHDGAPVADATNRVFVIPAAGPSDAGVYRVAVTGPTGSTASLPAAVTVADVPPGGGLVLFQNFHAAGMGPVNAPVYDADGVTPLAGAGFVAQLYGGPDAAAMRPVGEPVPFRDGVLAGTFKGPSLRVPGVPAGATAFVQVRAWDATAGPAYEAARAAGGRVGRSTVLEVTPPPPPALPAALDGLKPFALAAGAPGFLVGRIDAAGTDASGTPTWRVSGHAGLRYLVEVQRDGGPWLPLATVSSATGASDFTDPSAGSGTTLYRARLLD